MVKTPRDKKPKKKSPPETPQSRAAKLNRYLASEGYTLGFVEKPDDPIWNEFSTEPPSAHVYNKHGSVVKRDRMRGSSNTYTDCTLGMRVHQEVDAVVQDGPRGPSPYPPTV